MSDAMVEWLTGVLDEIERVAGAARFDDPWSMEGDWDTSHVEDASGRTIASTLSEEITRHIALNDPRAVLARVEAERAIVTLYAAALNDEGHLAIPAPHPAAWSYELDEALRLVAYGHRHDAEGFDPAWAPEGVTATTGG